jgi:hypothetical protein
MTVGICAARSDLHFANRVFDQRRGPLQLGARTRFRLRTICGGATDFMKVNGPIKESALLTPVRLDGAWY